MNLKQLREEASSRRVTAAGSKELLERLCAGGANDFKNNGEDDSKDGNALQKVKTIDDMRGMSINQLQEESGARTLIVVGTKELLERLCGDNRNVSNDNDTGIQLGGGREEVSLPSSAVEVSEFRLRTCVSSGGVVAIIAKRRRWEIHEGLETCRANTFEKLDKAWWQLWLMKVPRENRYFAQCRNAWYGQKIAKGHLSLDMGNSINCKGTIQIVRRGAEGSWLSSVAWYPSRHLGSWASTTKIICRGWVDQEMVHFTWCIVPILFNLFHSGVLMKMEIIFSIYYGVELHL
ncbi:6-phosphogluconate dehydrogenase family protein [Striga hermonthica]|uniref:6-phosphogluconate dehydrogenase family protein n=1 Tax=Striga hermonthica TaxID=68872 RepID=A0A9N7NMX0_STRHE|nr:6-phosphogluconate dehydrogenase family protein [Striga hermonthica]